MPNRLASLRAPAFLLVVTALGVGCGDDDPAAAGGAAAEPTPASPLAAKLAACPVVQTSEDPAASACLEGTYEGETLAGEACTLVVRAGGAYDFASPALVVSSAPQDRTIRVFSHAERSGTHLVAWRLAEPLQTGTSHELKFDARFGGSTPDADTKIDVEVIRSADGARTSSSCTIAL